MIIYMTLETDDGEYELEIEATGHINPPNLLADNPDDYYGEIYIEWNILQADTDKEDGSYHYCSECEIEELKKQYEYDIEQYVINQVTNAQGSFEE